MPGGLALAIACTTRKWSTPWRCSSFAAIDASATPTASCRNGQASLAIAPILSPLRSAGGEVVRLLEFIDSYRLQTDPKLRRAALRLAVILLHTTGLRRGELARLTLGDIDLEAGVLRIVASKFHKSRWAPLSASAAKELQVYVKARLKVVRSSAASSRLLYNCATRAYGSGGLSSAVKRIMQASGIWPANKMPRVHDLRHGFAVSALKRWYEEGRDVQSELP
jgi:integrase